MYLRLRELKVIFKRAPQATIAAVKRNLRIKFVLKINCVFKLNVERIRKVIKIVGVLTNKIIEAVKQRAAVCEDLRRVKEHKFVSVQMRKVCPYGQRRLE